MGEVSSKTDACNPSKCFILANKESYNQSSNNKLYYFETCISLKFLSRPVTVHAILARKQTYKINTEVRVNTNTVKKAISITNSAYMFVVLVIQHTNHMCRTVLLSEAWPALPYFSTVPH